MGAILLALFPETGKRTRQFTSHRPMAFLDFDGVALGAGEPVPEITSARDQFTGGIEDRISRPVFPPGCIDRGFC